MLGGDGEWVNLEYRTSNTPCGHLINIHKIGGWWLGYRKWAESYKIEK